jgi:hypothetical protein
MKKVYQAIVDAGDGDCMRAVAASLLEFPLEDVPHFLRIEKTNKNTNAHRELWKFFNEWGFGYCCWYVHHITKDGELYPAGSHTIELTKEILKIDGGIDGYFYASVLSQTFKDGKCTHAVVIDSDMNIVHDPNPNQLALQLTENDIIMILTNSDSWHIDIDGKIVIK